MTWAVVQFPGSNCDADAFRALQVFNSDVKMHWHDEPIEEGQYDLICLPGGFSFGDYLRAGSLAKLSLAIANLESVIQAGAHVIGICNGFQILLEKKILPGALTLNQDRHFVSKTVETKITEEAFPWFKNSDIGKPLKLPMAHKYGNYKITAVNRAEVTSPITYALNPNGSTDAIAGVYRKIGQGSAFGLMPHPERASFEALGLMDGSLFWENAKAQLLATDAPQKEAQS